VRLEATLRSDGALATVHRTSSERAPASHVHDVVQHEKARRGSAPALHHAVRLIRKARKRGYVIASESLLWRPILICGYIAPHGLIVSLARGGLRERQRFLLADRGTPVRKTPISRLNPQRRRALWIYCDDPPVAGDFSRA